MDKNEIQLQFDAAQDYVTISASLPVYLELQNDQYRAMKAELEAAMMKALAPYCR